METNKQNTPEVVAAELASGRNAIAIPPRKERRKMWKRIWKQVSQAVDVEPYFDILSTAADQMLSDLELGSKSESDLFTSDGALTDAGQEYVEQAFEDAIIRSDWCATVDGLAEVLNKESFAYFSIERAVAKQASE